MPSSFLQGMRRSVAVEKVILIFGILLVLPVSDVFAGRNPASTHEYTNYLQCFGIAEESLGVAKAPSSAIGTAVSVVRGMGVHEGELRTGYFVVSANEAWFYPLSNQDAKLGLDEFIVKIKLPAVNGGSVQELYASHFTDPATGASQIAVSGGQISVVAPKGRDGKPPI